MSSYRKKETHLRFAIVYHCLAPHLSTVSVSGTKASFVSDHRQEIQVGGALVPSEWKPDKLVPATVCPEQSTTDVH